MESVTSIPTVYHQSRAARSRFGRASEPEGTGRGRERPPVRDRGPNCVTLRLDGDHRGSWRKRPSCEMTVSYPVQASEVSAAPPSTFEIV